MKKHSAVIAASAFLCAASLSAVTLILCLRTDSAPDFVFSEPSPALISASETVGPREASSEARGETAPSASETEDALSVVTSNNPENRSRITFDGFDIIIEGVSGGYALSACLASDLAEEKAEYDGDDYVIILKDRHSESEYDTIYVFNSDNSIADYRVRVTAEGFEPIDTAETARNNLRLAESPVTLPREGVLQYITPDGDPEKAREVMWRAEEISEKICEGLTGDYAKAFAISQWVSDNIYYDYDASGGGVTAETLSLSHVLETHRTVCGGYSNLFSALCAAQGIEVLNIRGAALNDLRSYAETDEGELHEWNYALVDGRGVWVDAGWNSLNFYKSGKYKYGGTQIKYFDPTNTVLSYDHRVRICEARDYYAALE